MESTRENITVKLRQEGNKPAVYFTVVFGEPSGEPDALFVNCKEMDSFQWVTALMTSYSRQLGAGISIASIIEDMKATFSPHGAYHVPGGKGLQVNSLVHHLGLALEKVLDESKAG